MRNLKRALSLALASVMLLGMMVMGSSAASYPDVDQTNNLEAIDVLQMIGLMEGDEKGNFNPDGTVTRYQMSALVCKLLGLTPGGNIPFTDFGASDNWAKPYVAACYNNGIVSGTSATTFDGGRSVTAVEAGLMIMRTLNYFYNQSELGTDWKLATIREANAIDLYRGINAYTDQIMDRDNIAQMVLNALESNVVVARQGQTIDVQTGDVNVNIQGQWEYTAAKNKFSDHYIIGGDSDDNMQLCEKLYGKDLLKYKSGGDDDLGRPATKWTYKGSSVVSPKEPDLSYTKAVKGKDIYADLGKPSGLALKGDEIIVNGVGMDVDDAVTANALNDNRFAVDTDSNGGKYKIGGNGMIVEVYYDSTKTADNLTLVVTQPKVGQIEEVDENGDDQRIVKIGSLEYVTNAFEEDDWVVYTESDKVSEKADKIQSMYALEKQTGTLTKIVGSDKLTIDGKEYTLGAYEDADEGDYLVKDEVDFYLDANGYIARIELSDADVSLDNLAYVVEAGSSRGTGYAVLRMADGTKKTVDTDEDYSEYEGDDLTGCIVSFKDGKDGYKLTDRTTGNFDAKQTEKKEITFDKGQPQIKVNSVGTISTNSRTVFVYKVNSDVKVYTGYKNAPDITVPSAQEKNFIAAYCKDDVAVMVYLEVNNSTYVGGSNDLTFIAYKSDAKLVDEGDGVEYYQFNAVVDGKIETIRVDDDLRKTFDSKKIQPYQSLKIDADDIATGGTPASSGSDYKTAAATKKAKNDTISLDGTAYAYADDVKVFFVNTDYEIREGSISSIREGTVGSATGDKYAEFLFTVESATDDTITQIIIMEK